MAMVLSTQTIAVLMYSDRVKMRDAHSFHEILPRIRSGERSTGTKVPSIHSHQRIFVSRIGYEEVLRFSGRHRVRVVPVNSHSTR